MIWTRLTHRRFDPNPQDVLILPFVFAVSILPSDKQLQSQGLNALESLIVFNAIEVLRGQPRRRRHVPGEFIFILVALTVTGLLLQ